jgi:hypothetical protein
MRGTKAKLLRKIARDIAIVDRPMEGGEMYPRNTGSGRKRVRWAPRRWPRGSFRCWLKLLKGSYRKNSGLINRRAA